jgi:hypothetical protein
VRQELRHPQAFGKPRKESQLLRRWPAQHETNFATGIVHISAALIISEVRRKYLLETANNFNSMSAPRLSPAA